MRRERDRGYRREMLEGHPHRRGAKPHDATAYRRTTLDKIRRVDIDIEATIDLYLRDRGTQA